MTKDEFIEELNECFEFGDLNGIVEVTAEYAIQAPVAELSIHLAEFIFINYSSSRAEVMADILKSIIKVNPEIAQVNFPENHLFKLSVIRGSKELYDCFTEEAVDVFFKDKPEEEKSDYYTELMLVATVLSAEIQTKAKQVVRGVDFNGVFGESNEVSGASLIHTEDFEIMNDVVEKYNAIIGRSQIVNDLENKD